MWTLIEEGGWVMWFILAYSLTSVGAGLDYAARRQKAKRVLALWASLALAASTLSGFCLDFGATLHAASGMRHPGLVEEMGIAKLLCAGFGESMAPGIVGFTFMAFTYICIAIGDYRAASSEAAS